MKTKLPEPERPECAKLVEVSPDSQKIGEFIEWLHENGMQICKLEGYADSFRDEYTPVPDNTEKLLARYFQIDLDVVETERRALLEWIQSNNP